MRVLTYSSRAASIPQFIFKMLNKKSPECATTPGFLEKHVAKAKKRRLLFGPFWPRFTGNYEVRGKILTSVQRNAERASCTQGES